MRFPIRHHAPTGRQRFQADLVLLLVALVWGSAFAVQRVAAGHLGPLLFNGVRFLLGALVLLPLRRPLARRWGFVPSPAGSRFKAWWGGLAGLLLFGGAALQQAGLEHTSAGKAGFITGLYVVLVPLLLAVVWRVRPGWHSVAASLLAAAGLFLLSVTEQLALAPGDGLVLGSAVLWSLHVILIGRLAGQMDVLKLVITQYLVCGLLSVALGLAVESNTAAGLAAGWWTIVYTGVLSVGLGYTLQVAAQQVAPPADTAVILSLEAVVAALSGWLFLGELLTARQLVGCGLMFAAMLLVQFRRSMSDPPEAS